VTEPAGGPRRFRRRLTAAFVVVAALSSGTLAVATYGVASNYRWRNFRQTAADEVRVALALAPEELDQASFERLLGAYEQRTGAETIAIGRLFSFSSSASIDATDVPPQLRDGPTDRLTSAEVSIDGKEHLALGGTAGDGTRYVFFYSLGQLEDSLSELRTVLIVGWVVVVTASLAVGNLIAGRTLRPVREAAVAARAMAGGMLETRLPPAGDDEFGAWIDSFNTMAATLEVTVNELAAAAERERQFTADVAHDLRTPLTGMAATAALVEERLDELPPDLRRAAAILVHDVNRMKELTLELLELSRIDAGVETSTPERLDVARAVRATLDSQHLADVVEVRVQVPDGLEVWAERGRFRRILGNLVVNAAIHGAGPIDVGCEIDGTSVVITVADRGPGIDEALRDRVFDRFFKSDESRARGGSGLGLAIAREHARAMDGDVTVANRPGGGACFRLELPHPDAEPLAAPAVTIGQLHDDDDTADSTRAPLVHD
jgi:two-component system sensor histidine kinase MtrB